MIAMIDQVLGDLCDDLGRHAGDGCVWQSSCVHPGMGENCFGECNREVMNF